MHHHTTDAALVALLDGLAARNYHFITPLNPTYAVIRRRREKVRAKTLRDVLGWSLPFAPGSIDPEIEMMLSRAGCLRQTANGLVSTVRVSTVHSTLFMHSAYPTRSRDSVFLGPDSYRFAEFLRVELAGRGSPGRVLDVGSGAGVGGIVVGRLVDPAHIWLADINPLALRLAAVNAAHARLGVRTLLTSGLEGIDERFDLIVANPPFIAESGKTYSDGGGMYGCALSLAWASAAMDRLKSGGRLLLYTGSAIVEGDDPLRTALRQAAEAKGCRLDYRELDPDIFGSQLRRPVYVDVERIAAVGAAVTRL